MTNRDQPGIRPGSDQPNSRPFWRRNLGWLVLTVVIVALFASCTVRAFSGSEDQASPPDKYTQTWPLSYAETTCADWDGEMTPSQQFAGAADILTSARNKIDNGTGIPSDSLINEFASGITNVCAVDAKMTLTDVTYGLYMTEPRFQP